MIGGIRLKICGLTTLVDAELADESGADFLGFILAPASPRRVALAQYLAMAPSLPDRRRVAVSVEPTLEDLAAMRDAEFDRFQIHFRHDRPLAEVSAWSDLVGRDRLWLAPKLPAGVDVAAAWLPLAHTFLLDTFQADGFGGSGQTGDWQKFARHQRAYPEHTWTLAGGLRPENVADAVRASGARSVDVSSGLEQAPGIKDAAKITAFAAALAGLKAPARSAF